MPILQQLQHQLLAVQDSPSAPFCHLLNAEYRLFNNLLHHSYYTNNESGRRMLRQRRYCVEQVIRPCCERFTFHTETAFVATVYFDRFCHGRSRVLTDRQARLLSLACIYLASKMEEEILEPYCSDMCKVLRVRGESQSEFKVDDIKVSVRPLICYTQ
jgi:hypothetical protein